VLNAGITSGFNLNKYGGDPTTYDPANPKTDKKPLPKVSGEAGEWRGW
jgi:hypothetical protein